MNSTLNALRSAALWSSNVSRLHRTFPITLRDVARSVKVKHESLVQPEAYFSAIALRIDRLLESGQARRSYLDKVQILNTQAVTEHDCAVTWIYAKYFRLTEDGRRPGISGSRRPASESTAPEHREEALRCLSDEYLQLFAVGAIEHMVRHVGPGASQRPIADYSVAMGFHELLDGLPPSHLPRWLALSITQADPVTDFAVLDAALQLRKLLREGAAGRSGTSGGAESTHGPTRLSKAQVARSAAAWLRAGAPAVVSLARNGREALYDAITLTDHVVELETESKHRLNSARERELLDDLFGPILDLIAQQGESSRNSHVARDSNRPAGSLTSGDGRVDFDGKVQKGPGVDPRARARLAQPAADTQSTNGQPADSDSSTGSCTARTLDEAVRADAAFDEVAYLSALSAIMHRATASAVPGPATTRQARRTTARRIPRHAAVSTPVNQSASNANVPSEHLAYEHASTLNAISNAIRALVEAPNRVEAKPQPTRRTRTVSRIQIDNTRVRCREGAILRASLLLGAAMKYRVLARPADDHAPIALLTLPEQVEERVVCFLRPNTRSIEASRSARGEWKAIGSARPDEAPEEPHALAKPTESAIVRGLRAITGGEGTMVDAVLQVVTSGLDGGIAKLAVLPMAEFHRALKCLGAVSRTGEWTKLALLRTEGARAIALMPEFAASPHGERAWLALWTQLWPEDAPEYRAAEPRPPFEFSGAELDALPVPARHAYLLAYFSRFRTDAAGHPSVSVQHGVARTRAARALVDRDTYGRMVRSGAREGLFADLQRLVPLHTLAAALPRSDFERILATTPDVADLFRYSGPRASLAWMHAWRVLSQGTTADAPRHPAREAAANAIREGRLRLETLEVTGVRADPDLRSVGDRSAGAAARQTSEGNDDPVLEARGTPNAAAEDRRSSALDLEGEAFALLLTNDDVLAPLLIEQARTAPELGFLARVGGERLIRRFDDAAIAILIECAGIELTLLLADAKRQRTTAKTAVFGRGIRFDTATLDRMRSKAGLMVVRDHVRMLAARVTSCTGERLLAETPKADPTATESRAASPSEVQPARQENPHLGACPASDGPPNESSTARILRSLPPDSNLRSRAADNLLRIIGELTGQCEIPLDEVLGLGKLLNGRWAASRIGRAATCRKSTPADGRTCRRAVRVATELAQAGLSDEFVQLVEIFLTDSLDDRYLTHRLAKKRGGIREIHEPDANLKRLQQKVHRRFLACVPVAPQAHGFVPGRGTLPNAAAHVQREVVLNLDIRNFFGSLPVRQIRGALEQCRSGNLSKSAVDLLLKIVTRANELPQGAPTSPAITNIALRHSDGILAKCARRLGVSYTRYADDLTFSGPDGPVQGMVPLVRELLARLSLELHPGKTHVYRRGGRQLVTGLVVNERPNLPRNHRRRLRAAAHRAANGLEMHWDGSRMSPGSFEGRLAYLHMVNEREANALRTRSGRPLRDSRAEKSGGVARGSGSKQEGTET